MSDSLWHELPSGLLNKTARGWMRLDREVRKLVVELAREQNFKCAFCDRTKDLIIEHDHWPERGGGEKVTIYNIRGLACRRCNWHLGMYEADVRGDFRGWEDALILISEHDFEPYAYAYECRVFALIEDELEQQMGSLKYWRRRSFLDKVDDRREWRSDSASYVHYAELKERQRWKIRTPEQFWNGLAAIVRFVVAEQQRNPDFEIPEVFLKLLFRVKPILDEIWPQIEARYLAIKEEKRASLPQSGS